MENFIVSARKYRPATFKSVVGQTAITTTLKNAIRHNHLAQAFLFTGPRGVGKTTCARILAKTINCTNITGDIEACGVCESCISFNQSATFNVFELDAASNNSVEDIRSLVEQVRIPPQAGQYKVYIIDEVHMLSAAAFNAFLKTLEEPPHYAKFILATTEKHKIIPTILSRCQIYDFKRITLQDIANHLSYVAESEQVEAEPDALHIIAQKADGALRDALSMFDQIVTFSGDRITYQQVIDNLNVLDYDYYFELMQYLSSSDTASTLLLLNEIIDNGFDEHYFIIGLGAHLRNLLVCQNVATIELLEVGINIKEKYREQAAVCHPAFLLKAIEIINQCDVNYKSSNNKRLLIELALMKIASIGVSTATSPADSPPGAYIAPPTAQKAQASPARFSKPAPAPPPPPTPEPTASESLPQSPPPPKPEPAPVAAAGTTPVTRPASSETISIKQALAGGKQKKQNHDNTPAGDANAPVAGKPVTPFTLQQLQEAWDTYCERIKIDNPGVYSTLKKRQPELQDNHAIKLHIDNTTQEDEISEKRAELLGYLRERLNNYQLMLHTVIAQTEDQDKAYTPQDKFNKMAEKNPHLKQFKDQLGLDIDY